MKSERDLRDEKLQVHGDALLAEGLAQGSLIHLQVARNRAPFARRAAAQKAEELQLIADHRDELLGPLATIPGVEATFAFGFISQLSLPLRDEDDHAALAEALKLPPFKRLERLLLRGSPADLSFLADVPLEHLSLDGVSDWQLTFETMPPVRVLSLLGGSSIDFSEFALPAVEVLRVDVGAENFSALDAPELRVLQLDGAPEPDDVPDIDLLFIEGSVDDDLSEAPVSRIIQQWKYGNDDDANAGVIARNGTGRFGERAFLLSAAPLEAARKLASALDAKNLTAATCTVRFACQTWCAVELRMENATSGALLRQLSQSLAKAGHRTLEFAVSPSNVECIAWSIEPERVRALAMGPSTQRDELWRLAIDRALGADPGAVLDEVLLELDASQWVVLGDEPEVGTEWPLVTTFTPRQPDWEWDYDAPYEEDEVEENFDPTDFRDQSGPKNWWKTAEVEGSTVDAVVAVEETEEQAEEEVEHASDDHREDWGEVLAESPIDLESDGEERNPEFGLEPDSFDPDSVEAEQEVECEVCEARTALRPCFNCGKKVCANCIVGSPREDGEVKCTACAAPRPRAREPIPDAGDEEE
ncbi:MAG: hypothetical protein QM817_40220 [Archangium sp.]